MKKRWRTHCCGIIVAVSISLGLLFGSISRVHAFDSNPGVLPPQSDAFGMTYGEWSAGWWQWVLSLPMDQNPLFDEEDTCSTLAIGQSDPVYYFLGGTSMATPHAATVHNCTVPVGKPLVIPAFSAECSVIEGGGSDERALRACAASIIDSVTYVEVEIDGLIIQGDINDYRADTEPFTIGPLPDNNVLGLPAGATSAAVADGYWIILAPLSRGAHTVKLDLRTFTLDINQQYNLLVIPPQFDLSE